jgi:uncharacterized membrane protein (DUF106 family)
MVDILASITSIIIAYPQVSIIVIALVVTLISMLVTLLLTDRNKMKEIRERQKKCQELMKQHKGDAKKTMEIQQEMLACSAEQMKSSFKPMLVTMIPFLLLFGFIRKVYAGTTISGSWFWYYLVTAIVSSMIYRKILKM